MIFTERTITVINDSATINKPLILYRGDKNIELKITIAESQFKFRNNDASNVIETTDASYAQLVINTPYNSPIFSDVAVTKNGAVIFVITEAMIDEIREVGAYEIQIRLLDDNKQSRASIPPVSNAIEIREPIAIEDGSAVDSNAVNVAKVNRALTTTSAPLEAFDSQGNYIKKTWGDGDPITDAALNKMEAGIDGVNKKVANNSSQIKDIANNIGTNTFDDCIYNKSALKNINNREFFSMVIIGDSIGAGTAASNNYGFTQRFADTANYRQGFVKYGMGYFYYNDTVGWTKEETGINLQTISSSNASKEFFGISNFPWVLPTNDYKIAIVYCKKTDGGQFDVKDSDDNVLTTIDCSGENNLGCISDYFTVGAGKAFKICPKQDNKAYVIGAMIDFQPEKKGYKIVNWSVGGRQLCDYTKEEISTMILYDSFDTVYCELFANDSAMGKFDEYFDKLTYLIDTAKANKKDVILNITNRNQDYDATEDTRANFKKWENKMYEIAKEKNCCLINFDKLIGGHTVGKANGLIADTIHPSDVGHEIMAKLLNFVIFGDRNTYAVNSVNTSYAIYGKRQNNDEQYYEKTQYFNDMKIRIWDNNGNKNGVAPVMPIIRHWAGPQTYTKFAEEGALGSTGRFLYVNQNGINTQANWRLALTSPFLETVTTIPTVNDDNKNTIFRYRQEGKDDQIIVCVKINGAEQFKAIQLTDIV